MTGPFRPLLLALALAAASPAAAQLMLPQGPGGSAPTAPGAPAGAPVPAQPSAPPRPVAVKMPAESSVLGRTLFFNGTKGRLIVERRDKATLVATVIAVGEKMSAPGEACGLDLGAGKPLPMSAVGRPDGVPRFRIDIPACPIDVDLLDGAVLMSGPAAACPFPRATAASTCAASGARAPARWRRRAAPSRATAPPPTARCATISAR